MAPDSETTAVEIEYIKRDLLAHREELKAFKALVEKEYVRNTTISPLLKLFYGGVAVVFSALLLAAMSIIGDKV